MMHISYTVYKETFKILTLSFNNKIKGKLCFLKKKGGKEKGSVKER